MIHLFKTILEFKEKVLQGLAKHIPNWISANSLTALRALLALPVLYLVLKNYYLFGFLVFIFAFLLDFIDGPLARAKNQVSFWGKLTDPLADKILFLPIFLILGLQYLPDFLLWTVIGLELILILSPFLFKTIGAWLKIEFIPGANIFGKIKFTFQTLGVVLLFINPFVNLPNPVLIVIFWIVAFFALLSLIKHSLTFKKK